MIRRCAGLSAATRLRAKGRGLTRGHSHGDLYVDLAIHLPDQADEAFAKAAKHAQALYSKPIRGDIKL